MLLGTILHSIGKCLQIGILPTIMLMGEYMYIWFTKTCKYESFSVMLVGDCIVYITIYSDPLRHVCCECISSGYITYNAMLLVIPK